MNKLQKLSQINKDIELLENSGKIKSAEILHNKFIKEAQVVAPNRTNYGPSSVNPQQQNYVQKNENSTTSVRDGVSTNFNFTGLQPEMVPVEIETSPGKKTIVMRPKNNIGNPYATRPSDPFSNIPGYNEFIKLRPSPSEIRNFVDNKGTVTPAGQAIYNAKTNSVNTPTATTPATVPQSQTSAAVPVASPVASPVATTALPPVATTPQTNTNQATTQGSTIPKLQERVNHYNKKIQEYKNTTDQKRKSEMLLYLSQYIENNYDQGLLDSQSYKNLMTALGEKGLS
jgi:hypothetical protein